MADKVGLGGNIFKTNSKAVKSLSYKKKEKSSKKFEMKIWNEISEIIEPHSKLYFIAQESQ